MPATNRPSPTYTRENCSLAYQLNWAVSVFWRSPVCESPWLEELSRILEPDGIRILKHRFTQPGVSQFLTSTVPEVEPERLVARVKGRLQYLVRGQLPRAFKRNYHVQSIGSTRREAAERYVETQLERYPLADAALPERLKLLQIRQAHVDLSEPQRTARGIYIYNLHLVIETEGGWAETREEYLQRIHDIIPRIALARGHRLSRAAIVPHHLHLTLGCPIEAAPVDIALCYLNNLAYVYGMKPIYRFGAYVGSFGEYDLGVAAPKE